MHGLGLPRVPVKSSTTTTNTAPHKEAWEKPRGSGTLESIVNQATTLPQWGKSSFVGGDNVGGVYGNVLVPWLNPHRAAAIAAASASNTMTMDALVPCTNRSEEKSTQVIDSAATGGLGTSMMGGSTRVGSCSGVAATAAREDGAFLAEVAKRGKVATTRVPANSRDQSVSGSATFGMNSQHVTLDTCDMEFGLGFTSTSIGSLENTKTTTVDDHDSVCHSRPTVILYFMLKYLLIFSQ